MKKQKEQQVRVCPVSSDASRDYWLAASEARAKYDAGELSYDLTNSRPGQPCYIPVEKK